MFDRHLILILLIKGQNCRHIEISQLISKTDKLTGFYMMATKPFNGLNFAILD